MSHVIKSFVLFFVVLIAACGCAPESKVDLQVEENKALVRREFEEVWNHGKLDVMDEIYATDFAYHAPGNPVIHGQEDMKPIANMFYTAFPERIFAAFPFIGGGDHYNPYTNTINIYSDHRAIVLHEGGHAKDFARRRCPK